MEYIPKYILVKPDKQFRKDPATFLNNRSWEDELVVPEHLKPKVSQLQKSASVHLGWAERKLRENELERQKNEQHSNLH